MDNGRQSAVQACAREAAPAQWEKGHQERRTNYKLDIQTEEGELRVRHPLA